jgi:hypothetical protein|tara:strand:+ start:380 stop:1111 length:732 start_codon:yes stop_codon:yes gene_type:complete
MKRNILFIFLLTFYSVSSQIAVFHPVQVPGDQVETFEKIQTEYVQKIAQDAVDKGNLGAWALLKAFNATSEDYNYLWVHLYQDVDQVVDKFTWWANSEEVLGIKPDILYGDIDAKADRRYFYKMELAINGDSDGEWVILNFGNPDNVDQFLKDSEKIVMPHFEKMMNKSGMLGWGVATKITPQGKNSQGGDYATAMTYDVYDNLKNVMLHMSGGAAIEGLPIDKLTPANFSIRGIFRVITGTK